MILDIIFILLCTSLLVFCGYAIRSSLATSNAWYYRNKIDRLNNQVDQLEGERDDLVGRLYDQGRVNDNRKLHVHIQLDQDGIGYDDLYEFDIDLKKVERG